MRRNDDEAIREGFREESIAKAARDVQLAAIPAAVLIAFFSILDWIAYPELFTVFLILRSVAVVATLLIFFVVRTAWGRRRSRECGMVAYLVWALAIVTMVHFAGGYSSPYYAGINLALIVFLFMLPLDVKRTAIVCAVVYLSFIVPVFATGGIDDYRAFMNNNFFLVSTMILVIISSYLATEMRRKEFVARYQLARANEELTELDTLKSQFFANISHEVRTPLTSIIGPVYSLYEGDVGALQPDQQALVAQIYRNALRLLDMINQMLDFAKFEAGRMRLRLARTSVLEAVKGVVSAFSDVAARKGLSLTYDVRGAIPTVYLDREKLERILSNLVRNAIKFTPSGAVRVVLSADDDWIEVQVQDTGEGISAGHLEKIFERFQQVDGSLTRRYEGTGLGLAIVKEAVDMQRGSVSVESRVGEGSTFTVRLPTNLEVLEPTAEIERRSGDRRRADCPFLGQDRRQGPRRMDDMTGLTAYNIAFADVEAPPSRFTEPSAPSSAAAEDAIRVLYVEDNTDLREYVATMLARLGHSVEVAADGKAGWEYLDREDSELPDVVVSDIMMPRMDGYELLNAIKSTERSASIPVILTTAKFELDARIEGLETGADDYLAKPIIIRELDARIRNLVATRRFHETKVRAEELEARIEELSLSFSQSLELKDRYTAGHAIDVLTYGMVIAEEIGLTVDACVRESLLLHDIGKIGIPDRILFKEGRLEPDEWELMKQHSILGAELLEQFDHFRPVARIILAHQERYDGTGYPQGLKGEEIPVVARLIAVADAWHAMTENRVYRKALNQREAILELLRNKGTQFDPEMVEGLLRGLQKRNMIDAREIQKARDMVPVAPT